MRATWRSTIQRTRRATRDGHFAGGRDISETTDCARTVLRDALVVIPMRAIGNEEALALGRARRTQKDRSDPLIDPLGESRPRRRRLERVGEVLGLVHDEAVIELHDAH